MNIRTHSISAIDDALDIERKAAMRAQRIQHLAAQNAKAMAAKKAKRSARLDRIVELCRACCTTEQIHAAVGGNLSRLRGDLKGLKDAGRLSYGWVAK